jgi:Fur family ferric uptake transcriptional regulator
MSCVQTLKQMGYRLTPQRVAILEALHGSDAHVTADDIYEHVRPHHPTVNRSTVYRTLQLLKELGLVAETDLGEGRLCYHHIEKGHHHHLICQRCGRVVDVDESVLGPFQELMIRRFGFIPDVKHLALPGYCVQCEKATR